MKINSVTFSDALLPFLKWVDKNMTHNANIDITYALISSHAFPHTKSTNEQD